MVHNEDPYERIVMIKKFKNLDPMTKQTLIACGVQITILATIAIASVKLDKGSKTTIEN